MPDFEFLRVIGDDGAAVHFAARAHHGQHAPDGYYSGVGVRLLEAYEILVPRVLFAVGGHGHGFGVVAHRPAADGENEVDRVVARNGAALVQFFHRGIGHDARVLDDGLAALFEQGEHIVVNAVFLYRTAAVDEHDGFAVAVEFTLERGERTFAEIQFRGVAVGEISKHNNLLSRRLRTAACRRH